MKLYLASSFSLIHRVKDLASILEAAGHEITCKWWSRQYDIPGEGKVATTVLKRRYRSIVSEKFYALPETELSYEADLQGIRDADAFIFVADDRPRAFNGANVELGIALAWGKPCYVYGRLRTSVMYLRVHRVKTVSSLLDSLRGDRR